MSSTWRRAGGAPLSAFADASAVVKLYADGEGAAAVRDLDAIALASITRVEVPAAPWRKLRADLACDGFACFDAQLRTAAAAHGFEPIP